MPKDTTVEPVPLKVIQMAAGESIIVVTPEGKPGIVRCVQGKDGKPCWLSITGGLGDRIAPRANQASVPM